MDVTWLSVDEVCHVFGVSRKEVIRAFGDLYTSHVPEVERLKTRYTWLTRFDGHETFYRSEVIPLLTEILKTSQLVNPSMSTTSA